MSAAVSLHNALVAPSIAGAETPATTATRISPRPSLASRASHLGRPTASHHGHSRQLSSQSTATLTTATTFHSYPTEQLLHEVGSSQSSDTRRALLPRQSVTPDVHIPEAWEFGLRCQSSLATMSDAKGYRKNAIRRRQRQYQIVKMVLTAIVGSWTTYTTIRYFLSLGYSISQVRRILNISLGSSSAASLFVFISSIPLQPLRPSQSLPVLVPYISSVLLLGPAIVNIVFAALWRHNGELEGRQCIWDVDVSWSGVGAQCGSLTSSSWAAWLAASIVRTIITILFLAAYHIVTHKVNLLHVLLRRVSASMPPMTSLPTTPFSFPVSPYTSTQYTSSSPYSSSPQPVTPPFGPQLSVTPTTTLSPTSSYHPPPSPFRRSADNVPSLRSSRSRITITREGPLLRPPSSSSSGHGHSQNQNHSPNQSHGHEHSPSASTLHVVNLSENDISSEESQGSDETVRRFNQLQNPPFTLDDQDLAGFADRFRALVAQVQRETEEALQYGRPSSADSPSSLDEPHPIRFPTRQEQVNTNIQEEDWEDEEADEYDDELYEEVRRSLTPEDHIRMLGGFVRRMPTIESLGSREVRSLSNTKSTRERNTSISTNLSSGTGTGSRPPTRANTLISEGWTNSNPPSRSNSLNWAKTSLQENDESEETGSSSPASMTQSQDHPPARPAPVRRHSSSTASVYSTRSTIPGTPTEPGRRLDLSFYT